VRKLALLAALPLILPATAGKRFGVKVPTESGTHRYNVAPTQEVLAIVSRQGEAEARMLRWGLVPAWAKDPKSGFKMINARMESVATRAAYRSLIPNASRRALQVADGYYEWLKPEKKGEPRQPFFFRLMAASSLRSPHYGRLQR
jgi:putative SOS response-associated peptidase YedK